MLDQFDDTEWSLILLNGSLRFSPTLLLPLLLLIYLFLPLVYIVHLRFPVFFFFSFFIIPVETAEWHQNLPRVFAATLFFFFFMFFFFFIFCLLCTHTLKSVQSTTTALLFLFVYLFV